MKPPLFLWKSGTLDAFDSIEELTDRYPVDKLAGEDFVVCDSEGRIISAGRGLDPTIALACDKQQCPSPDMLRGILRGYLERRGMSSDELDALSLSDLVLRAYPPADPRVEEMTRAFILKFVVLPAAFLVCYGVYMLIELLCGLLENDPLIP